MPLPEADPHRQGEALRALAQGLQECFPGTQLTPLPDLPADGRVPDGQRLPEDYKAWIRLIGHGPIGDTGLKIYPGPCLGREVIPNHQRHGLSEVVVVAGDGQHHFVIYNTRFVPWYIHVVVGELGLMSALESDMTFSRYLEYLCRRREPHHGEQDDRAWWRAAPYFLSALVLSALLVFVLVIWGAWQIQSLR